MSDGLDERTKKLSEAMTENNDIINDVNSLIKEMKGVKDVNDTVCEKYKKECDELIEDLDEILEVLDSCKQEDDPTFKSFDSKKKGAKSSNEKSKKLILENLLKLEKTLAKNKEAELKKKKSSTKAESKNEKEDKNKKDADAISAKSAAGSSVAEDLEEVEEDLDHNLSDDHGDNVKESSSLNGKSGKEENINSKDKKSKKETKNKTINKDDNKIKGIFKRGKKDKENKDDLDKDKSEINEIFDDNVSETSLADEDDKKKDSQQKKIPSEKDKKQQKDNEKVDEVPKTKKRSIFNRKKMSEEDDKGKLKNDNKNGKDTKSADGESDDERGKDISTEDLHADKKHKKKHEKTNEDSGSIDSKHKTGKKTNDKKKSDDKTMIDSESIHDKTDDIVSKEKKKDKKSDRKSDSESIHDKTDDIVSKEKKKDKKSDRKSEEVLEKTLSVDEKKSKEKSSVLKSSTSPKKSENKKAFNDNESTISIRTQDSTKSESEYDEDFDSEEEKVKDKVVLSKVAESHSKPPSSLQRQELVESDRDETNTNKLESELAATTTFEHIEGFYVAIKDFKAQSEDDLSGYVGEEFTILEINDDGWWLARNADGDEGFVPISCLKSVKETKSLLDSTKTIEIPEEKIVIKESKTESSAMVDNEGKHVWDQIRQTMKEKGLIDTLKAFGGLPSGFRFSTLAAWSSKDNSECSMRAHLCPKLSESDLSFKDLQHDSVENKIRPRPVRIQRIIQISKSFQMPATSEKFVVKSRHIRMCLFNGEKAISNIHTMRAIVAEKDLKTWNFNSKITDFTNSLEFNEIFLRINHTSTDISILIEFCMLGFKSKNASAIPPTGSEGDNLLKKSSSIKIIEEFNDDDLIEFSVGWTKVPLYEENGQLITAKNVDYELFGGTPYEDGLEVDPTIGRTATGGKFKSLLNQSKQPQVSVRISMPNKDNKDLMETLPDTIIGSTLHLTNFSFCRRILSEELMDRRQNLTSAEPIYSPFLVSFMGIADHSDLLDAMRNVWIEKMKAAKNIDKKDYGKMNKLYQDAYMEYIYPLSKLSSLQSATLARQDIEENRALKIKEFIQRVKKDKLSVLLSGEYAYAPISFEEFSFKVVSKYSKSLKI